ncbi:MAG: hypothetical protein GWP91_12200 [Rhodobacterales bacterium]|nr:hypothetical protein [Rhodobacterales bacterium]
MQRFAVVLMTLGGCGIIQSAQEQVDGIKDVIEGLTNPLVSQGLILGVQEPEDQSVADILANSEFDSGTNVSIFLADASSASAAADAPVSDAVVTILGTDTLNVLEESPGLYATPPTSNTLPYAAGDSWEVQVVIEGMEDMSSISVTLPPAAQLNIPLDHAPLTAMILDFTDQEFDSAFVVVINQDGAITFTNEPTDISDVLAITQGAEPITQVEIPADAFPAEGLYAIGVAGMDHSLRLDVQNMNTALSTLMAGKMEFYATTALTGLP